MGLDLAPDSDRLVAQIAAAHVLTVDGTRIRLRDLWQRAPTLTGFVRHFGCLFCHQMVADLVVAAPEVVRRGGRMVVVGNGTIDQARRFFADKQLPRDGVDVVTDPDRESYAAAGFERGYARTFVHPGAARAFAGARSQGHRITGVFGDLTQLGGVLLVKPPATPLFFHRSKFAGDHPDLAQVLPLIGR